MLNRAVFLDRDGVIIADTGYIDSIKRVFFLPGVAEGLKKLQEKGFMLVIITNQSGVARGFFSEQTLKGINKNILDRLKIQGVEIEKVYYCPHHPEGKIKEYTLQCDCRKPLPGMILQAARELNIDLGASFLIGDSERDILAGQSAGCKTILLKNPKKELNSSVKPDKIVENLQQAVEFIFEEAAKN